MRKINTQSSSADKDPAISARTRKILNGSACLLAIALFLAPGIVLAATFTVTVDGSDAIFLAGRTDVSIPPASDPWTGPGTHLLRHSSPTPEEIQETLPPFLSISGGDTLRVLDPAIGGINFFREFGPGVRGFYGPSGNGLGGSNLQPLDGISGYLGPQGPLVGVFLDDSIPSSGPAPAALDFTTVGIGLDFVSLSPDLRQIFYIGDGVTSGNQFQEFIAPAGATRVFFGIPDGFGFVGAPGAYDDNDGSYQIRVGINEVPSPIPVPAAVWLFGTALIGFVGISRRRKIS